MLNLSVSVPDTSQVDEEFNVVAEVIRGQSGYLPASVLDILLHANGVADLVDPEGFEAQVAVPSRVGEANQVSFVLKSAQIGRTEISVNVFSNRRWVQTVKVHHNTVE